jgi:nucleoside-diphosphate-sugar epimerase
VRALVIGAKGFVGASLVRALLGRGHEVTALDLRGSPGRLADVADEIEWAVGDGSSEEAIFGAIARRGIDAIYYGPFFRAGPDGADLDRELSVMALGAWRVFQLARAIPLQRVVFPSSTAVHGYQPANGTPVNESTRVSPHPHRLYGAYKVLSEQVGTEIDTSIGESVVVSARLPAVYGPGAEVASRRVNVPAVAAVRGEIGRVEYTPEARVCIAHVEDIAAILATLLEAPSPAHTVYETGGLDVSFGEIVAAVKRLVPGAKTEFGSDERPILPHAVDWSRIRDEFGVEHRSLAQGMASIVEYERAALEQRDRVSGDH